jgi:cysteinyl-tRNA synthetase
MQFHNTLSRAKEEFVPLEPNVARMYCCGPTVYNFAHIGNLRAYIFNDVLRRALKFNDFQVNHVMNITDVGHLESDSDEGEDKMEMGAQREGLDPWQLARKYEAAFFEDTARLNIERPEVVCRATEHIPEMIALIERILEQGCGYVTPSAVYFDTSKFPPYAELARLDISGQQAGGGGRGDRSEEKRHPHDFVLWFLNKPRHIMQWDSPWGRGYPGWHVECSAMSMKYLGDTLDIHTGGVDHVPVHHTNEIAQSECATGKQFVRYWLHNEFLITEKKMSKSSGEFLTLQRVVDQGFDPLVYRYLCLQAHYRSELKFSWENLEAAKEGLRKVYATRPEREPLKEEGAYTAARQEALAALNDDLGTPQLVGILNRFGSYRLWREFDAVLGLDFVKRTQRVEEELPAEIQELAQKRDAARQAKDWAQSDALRNQLIALGYEVGDSPQGTTVKRRLL